MSYSRKKKKISCVSPCRRLVRGDPNSPQIALVKRKRVDTRFSCACPTFEGVTCLCRKLSLAFSRVESLQFLGGSLILPRGSDNPDDKLTPSAAIAKFARNEWLRRLGEKLSSISRKAWLVGIGLDPANTSKGSARIARHHLPHDWVRHSSVVRGKTRLSNCIIIHEMCGDPALFQRAKCDKTHYLQVPVRLLLYRVGGGLTAIAR